MRSANSWTNRRVEELVGEVTRVEVDAEAFAPVDRLERLARGHEVVGDLGGVHLEAVANALRLEDIRIGPQRSAKSVARLDRSKSFGGNE